MGSGATSGASGERNVPRATSMHSLLVEIALSDDQFGSSREREEIHALSHRLDRALRMQGAGEVDGDEFGAGTCRLFMYGPDADRLFQAVEGELRGASLVRGARIVKQYGGGCETREDVVYL